MDPATIQGLFERCSLFLKRKAGCAFFGAGDTVLPPLTPRVCIEIPIWHPVISSLA
jgi:hypothetical protein